MSFKEINEKVVFYLIDKFNINYDNISVGCREVNIYNYSFPLYESLREDIERFLKEFYVVLGVEVEIDITQLENNIGEILNIKLKEV